MYSNINRHRFIGSACKIFDLLALALILWLAGGGMKQFSPEALSQLPSAIHILNLFGYVSLLALWHASLLDTGLYQLLRQRSMLGYGVQVAASVAVAFALVNLLALP